MPSLVGLKSVEARMQSVMNAKLNEESIVGWLAQKQGWKRDGESLVKQFKFGSFRDSIVFVNRVASIADTLDHHPDIDIRFTRVRVGASTHAAGGITEKDLDLADRIDLATSVR